MLPDIYKSPFASNPLLAWNVLIEDANKKCIAIYNIFNHGGFLKDCREAVRQADGDRMVFEKLIQNDLQYYFWARSEWEIILSAWPPHSDFDGAKIDVYDQIILNWTQFIDYLWAYRKELLE